MKKSSNLSKILGVVFFQVGVNCIGIPDIAAHTFSKNKRTPIRENFNRWIESSRFVKQ